MAYKIAVVGATGNVGREMLNILAERKFKAKEVVALASRASIGKEVSFGDEATLKVQALDDYDFKGTDIAFFSPGSEISKIYAPKAAASGCVVIDNTSYFRMDDDIPLVVTEVNPDSIANYSKKNIIANPNCSAMQMLVALKPLHDIAKIKRIVVATYQSVSGAGKAAMDELFDQTKGVFMYQKLTPHIFTKQIAFNVIPHIDSFLEDGSTKEEWKIINETKKIMGGDIQVAVTCVRVPVFIGHSLAINVEFEKNITINQAYDAYQNANGVTIIDRREDGGYITPAEVVGDDNVFVSRIRKDNSIENGLSLWVVSDNLRKGAALNAIQIGELLIKNYL